MGFVSFLVLFILSHFVLLSSAEKEWKHLSNCSLFKCGKLGWLRFPLNNETNPECGLRTVVNCTEETPQIQLERGGRHFEVKNIQGGTIIIQDEQLQ